VTGFGGGLSLGFGGGRGGREPKRVRGWRAVSVRSVLLAGLTYGLVAGFGVLFALLLTGLGLSLINPFWVVIGIALGLPLALQRDSLSELGDSQDSLQSPVKNQRTNTMAGVAGGIVVVIVAGVAFTLQYPGVVVGNAVRLLVTGIAVGIIAWFVAWLGPRLTGEFITELAESKGGPQGPLESWRNDRVFGLVTGLVFGLAAGVAFALAFWLTLGPIEAPVLGLVTGLTVGLTYGITSSTTWAATLAWHLQLQRFHHIIPTVRLLPFLEDARQRGVLRTVGAIYQFRHATLQDHLTDQQPTRNTSHTKLNTPNTLSGQSTEAHNALT
jgi:hypothetical protein